MKNTEEKSNQTGIGREWRQQRDIDIAMARSAFSRPGNPFFPFAFWFWGDGTTAEELSDQASEMFSKGLIPGYIQARDCPDYLSENWFDRIHHVLETVRSVGCPVAYCDERGAPCGTANEQIPRDYPELQAQSLRWTVRTIPSGASISLSDALFTVAARISRWDSEPVLDSETLREVIGPFFTAPADSDWALIAYHTYTDRSSAGCHANYLDRRLPALLEQLVHEKYAAHFAGDFGDLIPGIFMDAEGDYGYKLAWSDDLEREYRNDTGRDIRTWMPLLHLRDEQGLWTRARYDWHRSVSSLYTRNFFGEQTDWYERHGMFVTAHTWEENLLAQALLVGDYFQYCRELSLPGTDSLYFGQCRIRTQKETQSVCEFEGKRFMSEIMACSGWGVSTADIKRSVNDAITWGVNHFVFHGVESRRVFDQVGFPPDFYDWNPYWRYFSHISDFTARASYIASLGCAYADVLLYSPQDTAFALAGDGAFDADIPFHFYIIEETLEDSVRNAKEINDIDRTYGPTMELLGERGIPFLITDDYYLGQMHLENGTLRRGPLSFHTIVLPPIKIVPLNIARLLVSFAQQGGFIYFTGQLPVGSVENGLVDPEMVDLLRLLLDIDTVVDATSGLRELIGRLDFGLHPLFHFIRGEFRLLISLRIIDGHRCYWLANNTGETQDCDLLLPGASGQATVWNCESGVITPYPSRLCDGGTSLALHFDRDEAFYLFFDDSLPPIDSSLPKRNRHRQSLHGPWRIWVDPADQPKPTGVSAPTYPIEHDGLMMNPTLPDWESLGISPDFSGFVDYVVSFTVSDSDVGDILLDLGEVRHMAEVWVNGHNAGVKLWGSHHYPIGHLVKSGVNTVHVKVGNLLINAAVYGEISEECSDLERRHNTLANTRSGLLGSAEIIFLSGPACD